MSGDALEQTPEHGPRKARFPDIFAFFAAAVLGRDAEAPDPEVEALAARARTEARAALRHGRSHGRSETDLALELIYAHGRAAANGPPLRRALSGPRWERCLAALDGLRHRQRSALALYFVLGRPLDVVARVLRIREPEARRVVEAAVARILRDAGEPLDVRRALRIAGSRAIAPAAPSAPAPPKPARMPRAVIRTLVGPAKVPERTAAPATRPVPVKEILPAPRRSVVAALIATDLLERLEREPPDVGPAPVPSMPVPARDVVPLPRRREPLRKNLLWAAALLALMLLALVPAGARDAREPARPPDAPAVTEPVVLGSPLRAVVTHRIAVVRRGDSLWGIAERRLGDGGRWPVIWRLNRGRIFGGQRLADPDLIRPGWRLRLPGSS